MARNGFGSGRGLHTSASAADLRPTSLASTMSASSPKAWPTSHGRSAILETTDPGSPLRRQASMLPETDMRRVWELRQKANGVSKGGECATVRRLGVSAVSNDTMSASTLQDKLRRHVRAV